MVKLLAMDTSTKATGIGIFVNGKYHGYSLIETDKKLTGEVKLNQMIKLLYEYIKKEKPDLIVVEETVVLRNPQVQRMLTELLGSIRGKCVDNNISFHALRPTQWRSYAIKRFNQKPNGRKREDQKKWSLDIVNNVLGIDTISDDICDAILLGYSYIDICNEEAAYE